jgi:hypothetical protein
MLETFKLLMYFLQCRLFSWSSLILLLTLLYGSKSLESPDSPFEPTNSDGYFPQEGDPQAAAQPSYSPYLPSSAFEPVAFSAVHASLSSRRSVSKISFDRTVTDIGYGWYSRRSEFICYYPGLYFFTFTAISPTTSYFKYYLVILTCQFLFFCFLTIFVLFKLGLLS